MNDQPQLQPQDSLANRSAEQKAEEAAANRQWESFAQPEAKDVGQIAVKAQADLIAQEAQHKKPSLFHRAMHR